MAHDDGNNNKQQRENPTVPHTGQDRAARRGSRGLLAPEATDQWLWIVVVGACGSLFAAFGIGANDVANAFATSVGARAVTLKQAIVLAGIFEMLGALLLGSHVTKTIREGIADVECFADNPGGLMYGMMCVVYTTGAWLLLASYLELPVSTTHATIGGIVEMAITFGGHECVVWYEQSNMFPYVRGVVGIVVSWLLAPVCAGAVSLLVFLVIRTTVLRSPHAFQRSLWAFPALVIFLVSVNAFILLCRGRAHEGPHMTALSTSSCWALGLGVGVAIILISTIPPVIRRNVALLYDEDGTRRPVAYSPPRVLPVGTSPMPDKTSEQVVAEKNSGDIRWDESGELESGRLGEFLAKKFGLEGSVLNRPLDRDGPFVGRHHAHDVRSAGETSDDDDIDIHDKAETFDPRAEEVFKYVQVVAAICDAFAHGANDVANTIAPFQVMYIIYVGGRVQTDRALLGATEHLMLALGGLGIVLGLGLCGHKIITAISVRIPKITPARGFSIEFGAAMVIITGTLLGLPLSTTHSQVGATAGVAFLEGARGLNTRVVVKIIMGWVITTLICGLSCALVFAQGAYAPHAYDII